MRKISAVLVLFFLLGIIGSAQELNCTVQVSSQQIQGTNKDVFTAMQQKIFEFMNTTKWTNEVFTQNERIEVSILINLSDQLSTDEFKGTLQISVRRPVYGSTYNTTIFTYKDNNFNIKFQQFEPLVYAENTNTSNLTSILAFYANYAIAMDYETFSPKGGDVYLRKALAIVNSAQSLPAKGWKAFDGTRNRYWLIENYLNKSQFAPLRNCMYQYHREGFDKMHDDAEQGRAKITEALLGLEKLHQNYPNSFNVQQFFNAKVDEIVKVYSKAKPDEKARIVSLLNKIDPGHQSKYQKILKSK
ncbi:MAG: DUF4835 family protein [Flavobacteriales bacterium]|nr:DUF4835 family protein [Flavobacteriales bacterium]